MDSEVKTYWYVVYCYQMAHSFGQGSIRMSLDVEYFPIQAATQNLRERLKVSTLIILSWTQMNQLQIAEWDANIIEEEKSDKP
jgi:hypothetical protein